MKRTEDAFYNGVNAAERAYEVKCEDEYYEPEAEWHEKVEQMRSTWFGRLKFDFKYNRWWYKQELRLFIDKFLPLKYHYYK